MPREVDRQSLDFDELISLLDLIDGERVIVRLDAHDACHAPAAGLASIVGDLRHQVPGRYEGHEFSIGTPYPDRDAEPLAGGILFLDVQTFQSATLTTFDGNDYFIVSIETRSMRVILQGVDSTYP